MNKKLTTDELVAVTRQAVEEYEALVAKCVIMREQCRLLSFKKQELAELKKECLKSRKQKFKLVFKLENHLNSIEKTREMLAPFNPYLM